MSGNFSGTFIGGGLGLAISNSGSAAAPVMEKSSLSDYVLLAIIALAALEALIVYRRRRVIEAAP